MRNADNEWRLEESIERWMSAASHDEAVAMIKMLDEDFSVERHPDGGGYVFDRRTYVYSYKWISARSPLLVWHGSKWIPLRSLYGTDGEGQ